MNFTVSVDTRALETELQGWEQKKLPYATATALTRTAKKVQAAYISAMREKFDRPTPWILNSTFVKPATATTLTAIVGWKDFPTSHAASKYMLPQVQGGQRYTKRSEKWLQQKNLLPDGMLYVPGSGAKMNTYGNMNAGQLVQVLSALQALPQAGYMANRTAKSSARALASGRKLPEFFVGKPGGGHLPLGVWQRMKDGSIRPILIFVKTPNYKILIPFAAIARTVQTADFQQEFNRAMRDMTILAPFLEAA